VLHARQHVRGQHVKTFTVVLQGGGTSLRFDDVTSLRAADPSGSFSILAGHEYLMTVLDFGLVRLHRGTDEWHHVALPGGVLTVLDDVLTISTRRFFHSTDLDAVETALARQLTREEESLRGVKTHLHQMEHEMLKRLFEADRPAA